MPREIALGEVYFPALLFIFLLCIALHWGLNWLLGRLGAYAHIWHPTLFQLALFVCLFGGVALAYYR